MLTILLLSLFMGFCHGYDLTIRLCDDCFCSSCFNYFEDWMRKAVFEAIGVISAANNAASGVLFIGFGRLCQRYFGSFNYSRWSRVAGLSLQLNTTHCSETKSGIAIFESLSDRLAGPNVGKIIIRGEGVRISRPADFYPSPRQQPSSQLGAERLPFSTRRQVVSHAWR